MSILVIGPNRKRVGVMHYPKTGGTWLRRALRSVPELQVLPSPVNATHSRHCGLDSWAGERPERSLTCLREPYSWLHSWFRYNQPNWPWWESHIEHPSRWASHLVNDFPAAKRDFATFVEHVARDYAADFDRSYERAVEGVDRVFRYEGMASLIRSIGAETGICLDGQRIIDAHPPENVSRKMDLKCPPELREELRRACRRAHYLHQQAKA